MTASTATGAPLAEPQASDAQAGRRVLSKPPRFGWWVVAQKELGDYLRGTRFFVLIAILVIIATITVYFASDAIRNAANQVSGVPSLFVRMFTLAGDPVPAFTTLVAFILPLVGIAFGFDSVSGERSSGTLPRLLSQPIHRDDVINGKFAAGLIVIASLLGALTTLIAAIGIIRLGLTPTAEEIIRLVAWFGVSVMYVGLWLAFATLCSVVLRRSASAVLVAVGTWLLATLFSGFIVSILASFLAPAARDALGNARWQDFLSHLTPDTLYQESTRVLLDPGVRTLSTPTADQVDRAIPSLLSVDQSLLVVWPQVVAILALMVVCFAVAYVRFMRQEVRA